MWFYAELPTTFGRINMYGGSWPLKLCAMVPFMVQIKTESTIHMFGSRFPLSSETTSPHRPTYFSFQILSITSTLKSRSQFGLCPCHFLSAQISLPPQPSSASAQNIL